MAMFILLLYWLSSFFSILIDKYELRSKEFVDYTISLESTIAYCSLITICLTPFVIYSNLKISNIKRIKNEQFLKFLAWLFFLYFVIYLIMSTNTIHKIITGDFGVMRENHYAGFGEEKWFAHYPQMVKFPIIVLNMLTGCPWIFQFLAFYSLAIQKLDNKYVFMFLCTSLIGIIGNLTEAGRSDLIYWFIGISACYIFFKPWLNNSQWKTIRKYIQLFVLFDVLLLVYMTNSRFGERDYGVIGGSEGGFIVYSGQSFIYFFYFYDNFKCPIPTLEVIFPFLYKLIGLDVGGILPIQELLSQLTGERVGVFYTFIGQILVASNIRVAITYCIIITFISFLVCRKIKNQNLTILTIFFYFVFTSILFLGLFSHYYGYFVKTFSVTAFSFIFLLLSKFRNSKRNYF